MSGLLAAADVRLPSISNPTSPTRLGTAPSAPTMMSPTAAIIARRPDGVPRDITDELGGPGRGRRQTLQAVRQPGNISIPKGCEAPSRAVQGRTRRYPLGMLKRWPRQSRATSSF